MRDDVILTFSEGLLSELVVQDWRYVWRILQHYNTPHLIYSINHPQLVFTYTDIPQYGSWRKGRKLSEKWDFGGIIFISALLNICRSFQVGKIFFSV